MERDCKFCLYYTWEPELLCAVEPGLVGNACECKHYDYDSYYDYSVFVDPFGRDQEPLFCHIGTMNEEDEE